MTARRLAGQTSPNAIGYLKGALRLGVASIALMVLLTDSGTLGAAAESGLNPRTWVKIATGQPIVIGSWLYERPRRDSWSSPTRRGVEIAVDEHGGRLIGHPVQVVSEDIVDWGCSSANAKAAAQRLASNPQVIAALGPSECFEFLDGVPTLWSAEIVSLSPSTPFSRLLSRGRESDYEGLFFFGSSRDVHGIGVAQFARQVLRITKAATLDYHYRLYRGYSPNVATFGVVFEDLGGRVTAQGTVSGDDSALVKTIRGIAAARPEIIYYPVSREDGLRITRLIRQTPSLESVRLVGSEFTFHLAISELPGLVRGAYFHEPLALDERFAENPKYRRFVERYRARYNDDFWGLRHLASYDAAMIALATVEKTASTDSMGTTYVRRRALRDAVAATRAFPGASGTINCYRFGLCATPEAIIYEIVSIEPSRIPQKFPGTANLRRVFPNQ